MSEYLNNLTNKLLPTETRPADLIIKIFVIRDADINACMFPNGAMYINTGMLANIENEAQLVTILGHELTHALNRHTLKGFRQKINASAFYATLYVTTTALSSYNNTPVDYSSLYMYSILSSINGYSREMENEADRGGFDMLLRNNYVTREAPKVFEIFEKDVAEQKERRIPYVYMDHPSNKARIRSLNKLCKLHEKERASEERVTGEELYNVHIKNLLIDNAILDIKRSRFSSAKRAIERFLRFEPQGAKGYYYLAELFWHRGGQGDLDKAIENYQKAISLEPNFASAHRDLGIAYYKNNNVTEAIREFEVYLSLSPTAEDVNYINKYISDFRGNRKE